MLSNALTNVLGFVPSLVNRFNGVQAYYIAYITSYIALDRTLHSISYGLCKY